VLDDTGGTVTYSLVRRPTGPVLGDADTAPSRSGGPAGARLAETVRDLVAGRAGAGNELAPLDIAYVVATSDSARRLAPALGRAATLTVVPAPGATVWRSSRPTGELTLLGPAAATHATRQTSTSATVAKVLPAGLGTADVVVPPGASGRLVVLAEPASAKWHATVGGTSLSSRTAYGWAQAFVLPSGGGRLHVGFSGGSRDGWLIGELVVLVVLVGAMLPARRPDADGAL
jgi:hypothetical protein